MNTGNTLSALGTVTLAILASASTDSLAAPAAIVTPAALLTTAMTTPATPAADNASWGMAIITQDQAALRAAPRDGALQQAMLAVGETVEVRGERLDYLQVYDHKRERGGFVRASQLRRTRFTPAEAPELLSVLRFVRDTAGPEALGIGLAAAYLKAAPAEALRGEAGVEALDALGGFADRLARRASAGQAQSKAAEASLSAQLDVAAQYGVQFTSSERDGRMQLCYDGEAFRRVLAVPAQPEQRARAALAVTRPECVDTALRPPEKKRMDEWRADVLDRVDAGRLPGYLKNRVAMRRAGVWSSLAYQRARLGEAADAAANRAMAELASINKTELTDDDAPAYNDAAMRVNASRWAALPASGAATATGATGVAGTTAGKGPSLVTTAGDPGETCVALVEPHQGAPLQLAKRCTYSLVWTASASLNREGTALAVAVQPMDSWRELWVFRKAAEGWRIDILPPASTSPDTGYAEFAGWVPGGTQMLVAREARGEGKYKRSYEVLRLDTLSPERQANDPSVLGAFSRWQDPAWKRMTVSVR